MAPKEAKKRMKASEHNKRKLLQTNMGPTPRKTVSHRAPSIGLKCITKIMADLEELRDNFILNEKSQMLVMVSMATDEMI